MVKWYEEGIMKIDDSEKSFVQQDMESGAECHIW